MILCCGNWKPFILTCHTSLLPPLFPRCLGTCCELLSVFLCCHLLTPFCYGSCALTWNDLLCCTLCRSCHRLNILVVHACYHSIYSCFVSPFYFLLCCLWYYSDGHVVMASNSLLSSVASSIAFQYLRCRKLALNRVNLLHVRCTHMPFWLVYLYICWYICTFVSTSIHLWWVLPQS